MSKWGLPKWGNPHGNRVSVVVRAREALYMAKGDSVIINMFNERCVRHYEKF